MNVLMNDNLMLIFAKTHRDIFQPPSPSFSLWQKSLSLRSGENRESGTFPAAVEKRKTKALRLTPGAHCRRRALRPCVSLYMLEMWRSVH